MISQHTIDKIYEDATIEQVVRKYVDIKKVGTTLKGCCPFHNEKTPSFVVSPAKNMFKCFGCGVGGGPVQFLMHKGKTFPEAIEELGGMFNISIEHEEQDEDHKQLQDKKTRLLECNEKASAFFHKQLLDLPDENAAMQYLLLRGFNRDFIIEHRIGWCPEKNNVFAGYISQAGYHDEAAELQLIRKSEKNERFYDFFRGRIIFPVVDHKGNVIAFGGRNLTGEAPKYLNSPESAVYSKKTALYGIQAAIKEIQRTGVAYIVEGYTDVTSMQRAGFYNTVAGCGTSVTVEQLDFLKRFTKEIVIVMDGDAAGFKALERLMPLALKAGFKTMVAVLPDGEDPDSFCMKNKDAREKLNGLTEYGFLFLAKHYAKISTGDPHKVSEVMKDLALVLNNIEMPIIRQFYIDNLKDTGIKPKDFKITLNQLDAEQRQKMKIMSWRNPDEDYVLPKEVAETGGTMETVGNDIFKYGIFMHRCRIYAIRGEGIGKSADKKYFAKISNFSIEIVQHMEDEKFPMKLVKMVNEDGKSRTFDTPSKNFNSIMSFKEMITNFGNFQFDGSQTDFNKLISKLFDEMGDGRMITVLGQQPEGFFAFSNKIIAGGDLHDLDEFGCFEYGGSSYYVPSGNIIYKKNNTKFANEKRAVYIETNITLKEYFYRIHQVHRGHGISGILFTVATIFSDIIYERISFFPLLFLYGEASTGKDNMIEACQALFGKPQEALLLSSRSNTDKARIRVLAQFKNFICNFREYKSDEDIDEMLKGIWDRSGYKRGNIDSNYGTDTVPIDSAVMVSSNDYPMNDALITRLITEEFMKTEFTDEEKKNYNELKEIILSGVSSLIMEILPLRSEVSQQFRKVFSVVSNDVKSRVSLMPVAERMIQNLSVLGAIYKITHTKISYPFTYEQWLTHSVELLRKQVSKREVNNVISKFWECFLTAIRDKHNPIVHGREFKIDGNVLSIQFNLVYTSYMHFHFSLYRERGLTKGVLIDKFKKASEFIEHKDSYRFGETRSSAYVFDLNKMDLKRALLDLVEWKEKEQRGIYGARQESDNRSLEEKVAEAVNDQNELF